MTIVKNQQQRGLKRRAQSAASSSTTKSLGLDSPSPLALKKKRVSFAHSLEETHLINAKAKVAADGAKENIFDTDVKPQKGILKPSPVPTVKKIAKKKKTSPDGKPKVLKKKKLPKMELEETKTQQQQQQDVEMEKEPESAPATPESTAISKPKLRRQQKTIQPVKKRPLAKRSSRIIKVRRSTKEILMGLGKKERREFIRQLEAKNKPNFELARKAKLLWEVIRNSKTGKDEKERCVQELLSLCRGQLAKLIYSHGTCRVVQCLIQLKRADIREAIFDELKPEIIRMAKSKYAKYFVAKMLKYGSKEQRDIVINAFNGHCMSLYRIMHSAQLLEQVYNEWANADQRHSMVAEFYGNEFTLFKNEHNLPVSQLNIAAIAQNHPDRMVQIVQGLEKLLEKVVLKVPMLKLSLTHKLLLDYLTHCTADQRKSMIDSLKDQLPEICHSQEGSRAALLCIWNADAKERKAIVKSFTGLALKTCQDQYARRAMFAIFDCVDDTSLVNEIFTKEIADNIADLVFHKYGIWTLHYLVHPRDYRVFGKGLYELLKQGDLNPYSTKPRERRYAELFERVRDPLLTFLIANMREVITNKTSAVLVLDTLEVNSPTDPFRRELTNEQIDACFRAIANIAADEFIPHSPDGPSHIVQGGCARFVFRKLLQSDPRRAEGHKLSDFLADLPRESLVSWTGMDCGLYTLVEMFKSESAKARQALQDAISVSALKNSQLGGARALLEQFEGTAKANKPPFENGGPKGRRMMMSQPHQKRGRRTSQIVR